MKAGETYYQALFVTQGDGPRREAEVMASCSAQSGVVNSVIDEVEPNDTTPTPLAVRQAMRGSLASSTDVDVFSFTSTGQPLRISLARRQGSARLSVRLKNGASTLATMAHGEDGVPSELVRTLPAGPYTLEVYADPNASPAQVGGDYELTFEIYD